MDESSELHLCQLLLHHSYAHTYAHTCACAHLTALTLIPMAPFVRPEEFSLHILETKRFDLIISVSTLPPLEEEEQV
jgi:hypothetical protein